MHDIVLLWNWMYLKYHYTTLQKELHTEYLQVYVQLLELKQLQLVMDL